MTDTALGTIKLTASDELESPARRALRRLFKRKGAVAGLVVIATFVLLAVFAPLISPYEPIATSWSLVRKPPSALLEAVHPQGLSVATMPSIDVLSVGGTVSVNAHGLDFRGGSLSSTIRSLRLMTADGTVHDIGPDRR